MEPSSSGSRARAAVLGVVAGAVAASVITFGIVKPPCSGGTVDTYTVLIELDQAADPPLRVTPADLGPIHQCDRVSFVNLTGEDAKIDFGSAPANQGTPFDENDVFTIAAGSEGGASSKAPLVVVDPASIVTYSYTVTVEGYQQSPVIRVGPRK